MRPDKRIAVPNVTSVDVNKQSIQHITQGEFAVGDTDDEVISTILGSCVAACLWDPVAGVGGMNHMLLPDGDNGRGNGVNAMELLINAIIHKGGAKSRLQAKLFGGSQMNANGSGIGKRNSEFTLSFLEAENIECESQSLGGEQARRVQFWPATGRARQKLVGRIDPVVIEPTPDVETDAFEIELF